MSFILILFDSVLIGGSYPCDVLRRKMQVNGIRSDALGPKYNGSIDAIKQIVRAEGYVRSFYGSIQS